MIETMLFALDYSAEQTIKNNMAAEVGANPEPHHNQPPKMGYIASRVILAALVLGGAADELWGATHNGHDALYYLKQAAGGVTLNVDNILNGGGIQINKSSPDNGVGFSSISTATEVPTATVVPTKTEVPTATIVPTATEVSTYKTCPPETSSPAECQITFEDLSSEKFAIFASDLADPFPDNAKPIILPPATTMVTATTTGNPIEFISFANSDGLLDSGLAIQIPKTCAQVKLPSGESWDVYPFYIQDPQSKKTITINGLFATNVPGMTFTTAQREQAVRDLMTNMQSIPGIAEGYILPITGTEDKLEKMIFNADPTMKQRTTDFKRGTLTALDKKTVLIQFLTVK